MAKLILKRGRAKPLWHGHPWVYAQAVDRIDGDVSPGDIVDIHDDRGAFVGRGPHNSGSAIAARIFTRDANETIDADWLRRRLEGALARRRRLDLPNEQTDCYRLVNAEGDGLPGLIVDVYGKAAALQMTGSGYEPMADALYAQLIELLELEVLAEVAPGSFAQIEGLTREARLIEGGSTAVSCQELGLRYQTDLLAGQKTGLYLDQRENHRLVRQLARGARVLDMYAYVGGFALNAARGGAASVKAVDASARAVEAISANAKTNGLEVEVLESDAFRALAATPAGSVDLLVLDPPKFARSRRELDAAFKGYKKLHRRAIQALAPGGLLISAVCSQLVGLEELSRLLAHAALEQHREARLLEVRGAGPDHPRPPAFSEGDYLKVLVCEIA